MHVSQSLDGDTAAVGPPKYFSLLGTAGLLDSEYAAQDRESLASRLSVGRHKFDASARV